MAVLDPDHLLDQAVRLTAAPEHGPPRQVDSRRAISAAYYALFHLTCASVADEFVGRTLRGTKRYGLLYRVVDHRQLKTVCTEIRKPLPVPRYASHLPLGGLSSSMRDFAENLVELQEKRHRADYNPEPIFRTLEARLAIETARSAKQRFLLASDIDRKALLTLVLCPPRQE